MNTKIEKLDKEAFVQHCLANVFAVEFLLFNPASFPIDATIKRALIVYDKIKEACETKEEIK